VVLVFNKPVTATISNVGTDTNKMCYKLSDKTSWTCINVSSSNCTPEVGKECAYLNGSDLIIKTYHFTQFTAVKETSSSSS
jgi:hypothetical protein